MSKQATGDTGYDLKSVAIPKLSGGILRLLTRMTEGPFNRLVQSSLLSKAGIKWFRRQRYNELPTYYPVYETSEGSTPGKTTKHDIRVPTTEKKSDSFHFNAVSDYAREYREGRITPVDVAEKYLKAVIDSDNGSKPLKAFMAINREDILKQAEASSKRFSEGIPLSILDGVPIPIKDQFNASGYPTTTGTKFLGKNIVTEDSAPVAGLRAAGAIIAGKTNMHELGLGVTGLNPHHGVSRNPYNTERHTGGSSSGSAAAIAAGISPASIGADGGGSIRIPASFCGLVGLKPTYGRVSLYGDAQFCWSVEHVGPLAATASDAAIIYAAIAGPDRRDAATLIQPHVSLSDWNNADLSGLTLGIYPPYFSHADPETVSICKSLILKLEDIGASVREIVIPGLEAGRVAHTITIAAEIAHSMERFSAEHSRDYGLDVRLNLAMARKFLASDYLAAQQVRTRMIADFSTIMEQVDVIITPTTGIPAPLIPEKSLPEGESDLTSLFEIMRFATPPNMTGLPSISFPAGYTKSGLPVGIQATGRAWQENTLLRLAFAAETILERKKPQVYYDLLAGT